MSHSILFVASLHHPEQLLTEWEGIPEGIPRPLFPTSLRQHYLERAMLRRGYRLDVFWRNLPGFGPQDIHRLQAERFREGMTPQKVTQALLRRLPARANPDLRQRNAALLKKAEQFRPEIVWVVGDNTVIYPETLATLKQRYGCKIVYATGVSPIVFAGKLERDAAPLYDLVLVNDFYHGIQWLELGAKQAECLPLSAIDPDFHKPQVLSDAEKAAFACDVTFVGTLLPAHLYGERVEALNALTDVDLGLWSVHDAPASLKPYLRGSALGREMFRVLSGATISLNVHGNFMRYGGNMRLFEAAGVGAFQISDERPGIHEWFTVGEHLVTYNDLDDLHAKVQYYLAHPDEREQIARAGREHALKHHTYEQRLDAIEVLLG
ncbi:glycosyltransferase [Phototrophicus methaneseepsis]|uniref:Glycosyltransferase n=1 Tax=Phototrophicus methaneseepsis TaxID=2710758 RepID=A0A7S8EA60_9CHLR|nr:glycosyltransferase [Phototrophicus methaneseepsis]QPC83199.1 glycosyltransferase [Phototrophicus methaneseepsis]